MKKIILVLIVLGIIFCVCSKKDDQDTQKVTGSGLYYQAAEKLAGDKEAYTGKDQSVQLEKGSDAYQLADSIAKIFPFFDPAENEILAQGNDIRISTGTVMQQMQLYFGHMRIQLLSMPEDQLRSTLQNNLENVVSESLIMNQIEKVGTHIDETEVDSILQIQYTRAGGEEQFIAQLEQNNLSIDEVKKDLKRRLLINTYFDEKFINDIQPKKRDVRALYKKDKTATVQHILFLTQGKSESEILEIQDKAKEVLALAKSGVSFDTLAMEYSEDPGSKNKGGLYENFKRGDMVKPFEDASFNLRIGAISDLVETQYGYHIIKVVDRKKETRPFEEVEEMLTEQLQKIKKQELFESHLEELKGEAAIEYFPF
ncbi:peptidylprolyl isomerase [bacterium]